MAKYVYNFGSGKADGDGSMKAMQLNSTVMNRVLHTSHSRRVVSGATAGCAGAAVGQAGNAMSCAVINRPARC